MAKWSPEPEFLKFLDALEAEAGEDLPKEVWAAFMEIRAGSAIGKLFYDKAMGDSKFRTAYEEWKKIL